MRWRRRLVYERRRLAEVVPDAAEVALSPHYSCRTNGSDPAGARIRFKLHHLQAADSVALVHVSRMHEGGWKKLNVQKGRSSEDALQSPKRNLGRTAGSRGISLSLASLLLNQPGLSLVGTRARVTAQINVHVCLRSRA